MNFTKSILLTCLASVAISIYAAPEDCKVFPSYNLISQDTDKKWHPVVGLDGNTPQILTSKGIVNSSTGWMRANPIKMVNDQYVELLNMEATEEKDGIKVWVRIKSSHALPGAYAVLTHPYHGDNGSKWTACKQDDIPNLTGEPQSFTVWFNNRNVPKGEWKLRFYHAGKELYDKSGEDLQEATPKQTFNLQLFRRNVATGNGDAKPAPFYMPMVKPDEKLLPSGSGPLVVKVQILIGKNGNIKEFNFLDDLSKELAQHLSDNIDDWLFFPRIKKGTAVDQQVVLPVQLR